MKETKEKIEEDEKKTNKPNANISKPNEPDTNSPLKETKEKIEEDEKKANRAINKPHATVTDDLVANALSTEDDEERVGFIERMDIQQLKEFYKNFKIEHPDVEMPEGIDEDLDNGDLDSAIVKLASIKLNKDKPHKPASGLNANARQIRITTQSQADKNARLEEETKKEVEANSAAESDTNVDKTTNKPETAASAANTPSDQIGQKILAAQNKTNDLLSQILAAILNKAEEITTPESTASNPNAKGTNPNNNSPTSKNSKASEMATNVIGSMKNFLNIFTGTKFAGV